MASGDAGIENKLEENTQIKSKTYHCQDNIQAAKKEGDLPKNVSLEKIPQELEEVFQEETHSQDIANIQEERQIIPNEIDKVPIDESKDLSKSLKKETRMKNVADKKINVQLERIQNGIREALESVQTHNNDLLMNDFESKQKFCLADSKKLFKFYSYAPVPFHRFRQLLNLNEQSFMTSLCSVPLIELSNLGKSGSLFYKTQDNMFVMKTISKKETKLITKLLPGFYINLQQNEHTLLPTFYGLFEYKYKTGSTRILIMKNIFCKANLIIKYDLKGATHKRRASDIEKQKSSPTYKDLDFLKDYPNGIKLEPRTYEMLMQTVQKDCLVLNSFDIMDYSLLLGVQYLDNENDGIVGDVNGEKIKISVGIIDILQKYAINKKLERAVKSVLYDGDTISVHNPKVYATKFQKFLGEKVFKQNESKEVTSSCSGDN